MSDASNTPPSESDAIDWPSALAANARWLRTVVFSRVADAHAVDDIMQNISAAVIAQHPVIEPASQVRAWLYRVAVRQSLMYRRAVGREKRRTELLAARRRSAESNDHSPNPLEWLLAVEKRDLVQRALTQLTPRDRELLLLKYTENWSCLKLAEYLGIENVSTVESRLDRARQKLRRELDRSRLGEET